MLIFNCTKAAADFFSTTKKGKKISPIEPAPYKTIAEDIEATNTSAETAPQWHWLVHAKKIKRKNVLLIMDYQSRFSITLSGLKKGDKSAFLNKLEHHLMVHVHETMTLVADHPQTIIDSLENYTQQQNGYAFYQRGAHSVQTHINDVFWHFERSAEETGEVLQNVDLIGFDAYVNRILRNRKGEKDYFYPQHKFLRSWLIHYGQCTKAEADQHIDSLQAQERAEAQSLFGDITELPLPTETQNISDVDFDNTNVVSLDDYRKQ